MMGSVNVVTKIRDSNNHRIPSTAEQLSVTLWSKVQRMGRGRYGTQAQLCMIQGYWHIAKMAASCHFSSNKHLCVMYSVNQRLLKINFSLMRAKIAQQHLTIP